ncbi:hypothetical protein [Bacillus sp. JJ722]|uniref:hypothetical protein n=1 Tax=Bacillus sp. JJ722 TaxID=3122973 RepID=UPI002FFE95DB
MKDILSDDAKKNLKEIRLYEKLTTREWEDIMGKNRDRYERLWCSKKKVICL